MKPLPTPLASVVVPRFLSPSQLHQAITCRLRAVLSAGKPSAFRLAAGPAAELGSVIHALYRRAALGVVPRDGGPRLALERELQRLLASASRRLASETATAAYADLPRTLTATVWRNQRERALTTAERLLNEAPARAEFVPPQPPFAPRYESLPETGRWPEVVLESETLRLSGRADLIEKQPGETRVVDFKSGVILDRRGEILPHLRYQMLWYGLLVRQIDPGRSLTLELTGNATHRIPFDDEAIAEARDALKRLVAALPEGSTANARELASVGPGCLGCRFRAACPAYRDEAPSLWESGSADRMPVDIWGQVLEVTGDAGRGFTLKMRDDAGRLTRIVRLDPGHFSTERPKPGGRLGLFNLGGRSSRVRGKWIHPRNFYEAPADSSQRRAWGLTLFAGSDVG